MSSLPLPPLTEYERRLLDLLAQTPRQSDAQIRLALGVSQDALVRLGQSAREKLGLDPGASLRAKARALSK